MKAAAVTLLLVLPVACGPPRADRVPVGQDTTCQPPFVGKAWLSTDPTASPGTLRIFLSDGTLLMDSCGETYRLARWRAIDDRRLEWTEDTARIEAQITRLTDDELQLRLQLVGAVKNETYRLARPPYLCPDLPR
jgi:hypothetical protein